MLPRQLFDDCLNSLENELKVHKEQRPKIKKWFSNWLSEKIQKNPGSWASDFSQRLESLAGSVNIDFKNGRTVITCDPGDATTLTLLRRGSKNFNAIDSFEEKLIQVISSTDASL